jgi:hypothetical protein
VGKLGAAAVTPEILAALAILVRQSITSVRDKAEEERDGTVDPFPLMEVEETVNVEDFGLDRSVQGVDEGELGVWVIAKILSALAGHLRDGDKYMQGAAAVMKVKTDYVKIINLLISLLHHGSDSARSLVCLTLHRSGNRVFSRRRGPFSTRLTCCSLAELGADPAPTFASQLSG